MVSAAVVNLYSYNEKSDKHRGKIKKSNDAYNAKDYSNRRNRKTIKTYIKPDAALATRWPLAKLQSTATKAPI